MTMLVVDGKSKSNISFLKIVSTQSSWDFFPPPLAVNLFGYIDLLE